MKARKRAVTYAIVAAIAIALMGLGQAVLRMTKMDLLKQRFSTLIEMADTRCIEAESLSREEWLSSYGPYARHLCAYFSEMDTHKKTFSAVYDGELELLSNRHPRFPNEPFVPTDYPEVVSAVYSLPSARFELLFEPTVDGQKISCPMLLYFRKIPTYGESNFLVVMVAQDLLEGDAELSREFYELFFIVFGVAIIAIASLIVIFTHPRYVIISRIDKEA